MPVGPVNTSAISRTLKHGFKIGLAVGAGAALMDIIYCGGAAQINEFLIASPVIKLIFEIVGFAALILLGIRQLRSKLPGNKEEEGGEEGEHVPFHYHSGKKEGQSLAESFVIGVLLYATNVMAVPEWIIVSGLWRSWGLLGTGFGMNAAFAVGAGVGTFGWFTVLIRWIARHHRGFRPSTLQNIRVGTGIVMLLFAGYFAYAIVFETQWNEVKSHVTTGTEKVIGMRMSGKNLSAYKCG